MEVWINNLLLAVFLRLAKRWFTMCDLGHDGDAITSVTFAIDEQHLPGGVRQ